MREKMIWTYRLCLESLYGFDMGVHIISDWTEILEKFFGFVYDSLILQDGAVVVKVDCGGLRGRVNVYALSVSVAFSKSLQSGDGLCKQVRG
jgi:hypothetical protein